MNDAIAILIGFAVGIVGVRLGDRFHTYLDRKVAELPATPSQKQVKEAKNA